MRSHLPFKIGSDEWKEWRRERIGASDSASILGISPFKTLRQLCEEKILKKDPLINKAMQRGMDREAEALAWLENKLDISLEAAIETHIDYPWKYATMDGISEDSSIAVEIKWANEKVHQLAGGGKVIDYYLPQVQSQLACCGLGEMYFLSCRDVGGVVDYKLVTVKRDEEFIENMIQKEKYVYENYILPKKMPEQEFIEDSFVFDMLMSEEQELTFGIQCASDFLKEKQKKRDEIRERLVALCKGESCQSSRFKMTKSLVKGNIDYSIVPELEGVDLEPYRKESREQWRFTEI